MSLDHLQVEQNLFGSGKPCVSIGLPVFNGEKYIREALDAFLNQTFSDFELIVSDNTSTDATEEICREYARKDHRIRYHRNETNLGPGRNFNRVFELARGKYFKWAACDDLCAPEFLEQCVAVLEQDPSVVLCYSKAQIIDSSGRVVENYNCPLNTDSPRPQDRFRELIFVKPKRHRGVEIFGLIRTDVLKSLPPQGCYASADRIHLTRLALCGRFYELPEYLFFYRSHVEQSVQTLPDRILKGRSRLSKFIGTGPLPPTEWWDASKKGRIVFPEWRICGEFFKSVGLVPSLSWYERTLCYLYVAVWSIENWLKLVRDLIIASEQFLVSFARLLSGSQFRSMRLRRGGEG